MTSIIPAIFGVGVIPHFWGLLYSTFRSYHSTYKMSVWIGRGQGVKFLSC